MIPQTHGQAMITHPELLAAALTPLDSTDLECDGSTQAASTVLWAAGVAHTVHGGQIVHRATGTRPPIHFWIEIDGLTLDYRARMWLGTSPDVPHGLFRIADYPSVAYIGNPGSFAPWPPSLFEAFTGLELAPLVEAVQRALRGEAPLEQSSLPKASLLTRITQALDGDQHKPGRIDNPVWQPGYSVAHAGQGHASVRYRTVQGIDDPTHQAERVAAYQATLELAGFVVFYVPTEPPYLLVQDTPGIRSHSKDTHDQR